MYESAIILPKKMTIFTYVYQPIGLPVKLFYMIFDK